MNRLDRIRSFPKLVALCVILASSGCIFRFGPSATEVGGSPRGVSGRLEAGGTTINAEVLAVEDGGLITLVGNRVARLPWSSIAEQEIEGGSGSWDPPSPPDAEGREWLRRASRFPLGIEEEELEALLEFHGQNEPDAFPTPSQGVSAEPTLELLAQARGAAVRYRSTEEARLSGYRPIGPDFPGMGQHWVNAFILLRGGTNPEEPPFLTYLETPSGTVLTGLALGRVLTPGEHLAGGHSHDSAWHDHSGTIDEELLALNPEAARHADPQDFRLSMLHLWTDLDNPEGPFAQDNWAVPFARLGLPVPDNPSAHQGKALFLASGGDRYYRNLIDALVALGPDESRAVDAAFARHREMVEDRIAMTARADVANLWPSLWDEIRGGVTPEHWAAIETLSR